MPRQSGRATRTTTIEDGKSYLRFDQQERFLGVIYGLEKMFDVGFGDI
jgi:hypothetical protein